MRRRNYLALNVTYQMELKKIHLEVTTIANEKVHRKFIFFIITCQGSNTFTYNFLP